MCIRDRVVSVGDTIEVYVKDIDTENHKGSLGYKKSEDNPWEQLKNKEYEAVREDIRAVKQAVGDKILKVIIETCLLTSTIPFSIG